MTETINLKAKSREIFGKKNRALRKTGLIPAILYGHKIKNIPIAVDKKEFNNVYDKAGQTTLINLNIADNEKHKVLIHDVQYDPINGDIIHIDFHQIKMTEKIKTDVPIVTVGESPAVKELEGTLILNKSSIQIECLPQDLIHEIKIDISNLKTFEDKILVGDLYLSENISVLDNPEEVVALVTPPRSEEELKELEEKVEEKPEEVEVEAEKPEEGEEIASEESGETPKESAPQGKDEKPDEENK